MLSPQSSVEQAIHDMITAFEAQKNTPIFIVYGDVRYFNQAISAFRTHCQRESGTLYLPLDMELAKREIMADTLFEILQQLAYGFRLIEKTDNSSQKSQIQVTLDTLQKIRERIKNYEADDKLVEFVNFIEFVFSPTLKNICKQPLIIELNRFEKIVEWGVNVRNFILERLLQELSMRLQLQYVLFVEQPYRPRLYYGSDQEYSTQTITFYALPEIESTFDVGSSEDYDVFLCHESQDKPAVKEIGKRLKERGLRPWLDEWELRPGLLWQIELERQIENIQSAAVFVGPSGFGPWQDLELKAFLMEFVKRKCPVIPVILPDCEETPELPSFLKGMRWVDFRKKDPDPFEQLVWGITGTRVDLDDWIKGVNIAKKWNNANK